MKSSFFLLICFIGLQLRLASAQDQNATNAAPENASPAASLTPSVNDLYAQLGELLKQFNKDVADPDIFATPETRKAAAMQAVPVINKAIAIEKQLPDSNATVQKYNDSDILFLSVFRLALDDPAARSANANASSGKDLPAATAVLIRGLADYLDAEQDPSAQSAAIDKCCHAIDMSGADPPWLPPGVFIKNPPANATVADKLAQAFAKEEKTNPFARLFIPELTSPELLAKLRKLTHTPLIGIADKSSQADAMAQYRNKPMTVGGPLVDGSPFTTTKWKGKVIVVDFWATWCGPCVQELPNVAELYNKYHNKGLEIVAVSSDVDTSTLKTFLARNRYIQWPQIFDAQHPGEGPIATHYVIATYPTKFIIDRKGVLRDVFVGSGPEILTNIDEIIDQMISEKP